MVSTSSMRDQAPHQRKLCQCLKVSLQLEAVKRSYLFNRAEIFSLNNLTSTLTMVYMMTLLHKNLCFQIQMALAMTLGTERLLEFPNLAAIHLTHRSHNHLINTLTQIKTLTLYSLLRTTSSSNKILTHKVNKFLRAKYQIQMRASFHPF